MDTLFNANLSPANNSKFPRFNVKVNYTVLHSVAILSGVKIN